MAEQKQQNSRSKTSQSSAGRQKTGKPQARQKKKAINEKSIMVIGTLVVLAVAFMYRASGCDVDLDGALSSLSSKPESSTSGSSSSGGAANQTSVHFLDVGQGDSILICGTGKNILIDGGEREAGSTVIADLKEYGVEKLDYIIATHPHADHIGGLVDVLKYSAENSDLSVGKVIIPDVPEENTPTTATYRKFMENAAKGSDSVAFAEYNMNIDIGSGTVTVLPPVENKKYDSLNDYSVCAYLDCGDISFFFTGDMEKAEEKDMLDSGRLNGINATVLKAGHHGSSTSSSERLLDQIDPQYVVISCGKDNDYGHPHKEAMNSFRKYADKIYRTDTNGTVTASTDGKTIEWTVKGS